MAYKHLLASLCLGLCLAATARGQQGLGTPITPESANSCPPSESASKAHRPLFGLARGLLTPFRSTPQLLPPQPAVELPPTKEDIARMVADGNFSPAEVTAAKIKMDEAQAKARQAAVRYLATVDCNYYPEAEAGLIAALRADRSEGVRHEAAVALGTCRGTTKRIVDALNLSALGQDLDGNPPESSERVRQAARNSLNRALSNNMTMYPMDMSMMMPMPMMPTMPMMDWFDPYAMQPANYLMPMPYNPLALSPATREERERAENVGAQVKSTATSVTAPSTPRSLIGWIQSYTSPRETSHQSAPASQTIDPRLRGLTPLGSGTTLSLPGSPAQSPAYNSH